MSDNVSQHLGSCIEMSQHRNYLELSNLVCFYNEPSLNMLQLDCGDSEEERAEALQKAQTLCLMPVYAKVTTNIKGEPTFAGHEAVRKASGEVIYKTIPIGVHSEVAIEDHEVEIPLTGEMKTLPCLVAKQRIWARNKNAVAAIKRLFSQGHMHNSFEMEVSEYVFTNGVRHAKDYEFVGNAFLASDSILRGASVQPAYGNSARVTEIAQEQPDYEYEFAQALAADLEGKDIDEVIKMIENENANVETIEQSEQVEQEAPAVDETAQEESQAEEVAQEAEAEGSEPEVTAEESALTDRDIRTMIEEAYNKNHTENYAYVVYVFSEEHMAWLRNWKMRETEYVQIAYTVEDNQVTIGEETVVEIALPVRELSAAYIQQQEEIKSLKSEICDLTPYMERVKAEEAAAEKAKHEKEVSDLRALAEKAECFSKEEIAQMNDLFEQVKTNDVKAAIYDKKVAMMNTKTEVSTVEEVVEEPKANLEQESQVDYLGSVRRFLNN